MNLYEKIVTISEQKEKFLKENESLKSQLTEAISKIQDFEKKEGIDFVGKLTQLVESISIDEKGEIKINESLFGQGKNQEIMIAKYFVKAIEEKARQLNLDAKKIAEEIITRIK